MYAYKVYHEHGYLTVHPASGKLVLDASKTLACLDAFAATFEKLLGFMDAQAGAGLEKLLFEEIAPENAFVRVVTQMIAASKATGTSAVVRPERGCSCHPTWSLPKCTVCPTIRASG